jgi:hypothetical protein
LPEVIDDPAKEQERVDQEKAATKKLTEGGSV